MYESLTKYLDVIDGDTIGTWVVDKENDGTPKRPFRMPYVDYSKVVKMFVDDVHLFINNHEDMELTRCSYILNSNGIKWGMESMTDAAVDSSDGKCVMALIVGSLRMERFCDGALFEFFDNGSIEKWLKRLKELDERH